MSDDFPRKRGNGDAGSEIVFDYIKSSHFRVIRADGAVGAITPSGHIHFALYSERPAIPRQTVHEIDADGRLGDEKQDRRVSKGGIVREMEVDVFLTPEVAEGIKTWLETTIKEARNRQTESPQRKN